MRVRISRRALGATAALYVGGGVGYGARALGASGARWSLAPTHTSSCGGRGGAWCGTASAAKARETQGGGGGGGGGGTAEPLVAAQQAAAGGGGRGLGEALGSGSGSGGPEHDAE